jgi:ATP-dependent Clp endopeptidase proteolytic subunit ClpP
MKNILLYTGIYSWTAETFAKEILELQANDEVTVRINTPGGSVFAGNSMFAILNDHKGRKTAKVDGHAASMGAFILPYFDEVIASDISRIMIHRADGYAETEEEKAFLASINKDLRAKFEKKINIEAFKQVTGKEFSEVFEAEKRQDFWLTAKEAKKIGLVDKIVRLEPKEIEAMQHSLVAYSDMLNEEVEQTQGSEKTEAKINNNFKSVKMNLQTLKAENPALFEEILALGISQEQNRVKAWMAFKDIDSEKVMASIEAGTEFNPISDSAYFTAKGIKNANLQATVEETVEAVEVADESQVEAKTEADKLEAEVFASLNLKKEVK